MRTLLLILFASSTLAGASDCPALTETVQGKLVQYVQRKFKVSPTISLTVSQEPITDSCFHRLNFSSRDQGRPYNLDLIASPDFRFLTKEVLDIRIDPLEEERAKQRALAADLARGGSASLGPAKAPVTINLFSDFQCPFCSQLADGLMKDILPVEGDRVRIVFRNFPLPMHPWARQAAEATACARQQGDGYFWSLHDYLFGHQQEITPSNLRDKLTSYAQGLADFDSARFAGCIDQHQSASEVEADIAMGHRLGITGTPTMFVNTERLNGFRPEPLKSLIRQLSTDPNLKGDANRTDSKGQGQETASCTPEKCDRK